MSTIEQPRGIGGKFASRPLHDRFWEKVNKTDTCWLWTASTMGGGYGKVWVDGRERSAHRLAYELLVGPIPNGLELDHLCRNPSCVNPAHLEAVTHRENMLRGEAISSKNARATHCPSGHAYSGDNLYVTPKGDRRCRTCKRLADKKRDRRTVTRSDVLHRAADLLEEFGWCQGQYARDRYGHVAITPYDAESFCAAGAIGRALIDLGQPPLGDDDWRSAGMTFLWEAIDQFSDDAPQGSEWNDAPGRTKSEVVARLRQAAETA